MGPGGCRALQIPVMIPQLGPRALLYPEFTFPVFPRRFLSLSELTAFPETKDVWGTIRGGWSSCSSCLNNAVISN